MPEFRTLLTNPDDPDYLPTIEIRVWQRDNIVDLEVINKAGQVVGKATVTYQAKEGAVIAALQSGPGIRVEIPVICFTGTEEEYSRAVDERFELAASYSSLTKGTVLNQQALLALVHELLTPDHIAHWAANAAAKELLEHWATAVYEGWAMAHVIKDLDMVIDTLFRWKAALACIPETGLPQTLREGWKVGFTQIGPGGRGMVTQFIREGDKNGWVSHVSGGKYEAVWFLPEPAPGEPELKSLNRQEIFDELEPAMKCVEGNAPDLPPVR